MSFSEETRRKLEPADPRVGDQPSLMPQSTKDSRLGALPSSKDHVMTPGERMEEKYKLLERFCRQTWINHGMIGGGVATLLSAGTMLVAQRKRWFGTLQPSHIFITGAFAFAFGFFFRAERVMKDCYYLGDVIMSDGDPASSRRQNFSIMGEPNEVDSNPKAQIVNDLPNEALARFTQSGKATPQHH